MRQVGRKDSNTLVLSATNGKKILFWVIWPHVNAVLHLRLLEPLDEGFRGMKDLLRSSAPQPLRDKTGHATFTDEG